MKQDTYNWIWEQIDDTIKNVENKLDETEKERLSFQRTYSKNFKIIIKKEYEKVKKELKSKCYDKEEEKNPRIDQHKIAACFCRALIQKKVFTFNIDDSITKDMLLSNYEVAYTVSMRIIFIYLIDYYIRKHDEEYLGNLINQKCLKVPKTTNTHDLYNEGRIKTLALNDYHGMPLDLLMYSDMMYWIEYYNRQLIEDNIKLVPNDPFEDAENIIIDKS